MIKKIMERAVIVIRLDRGRLEKGKTMWGRCGVGMCGK
jgi:hypothetical protein